MYQKFNTRCNTWGRGFTLIELLVVVAIVALLLTLATPSFHKQISSAHRSAAKLTLLDLLSAQRLYHLRHKTYTHALNDLPDAGQAIDDELYIYEARACPPGIEHCVELLASPRPPASGETLTVDSGGRRSP